MLSALRKNAGSLLIKIVLALIAVVFVFWGVGSFRDQGVQPVAVVNGTPIAYEAYAQAYDNLLENYRRSFGDNLNEDLLKMLNVRRQAMDRIVDQQLLLAEARELNLQVTDAELAAAIQSMPVFQVEGRFDSGRYGQVLSANRFSPEGFEQLQRDGLLMDKLQKFLRSGVKVSEPEAREFYDWQEASVSIDYIRFDPASYTDIEPSEEELTAFYEENKANYRTEPHRRVKYLKFSADDFKAQVDVAEEQVTEYFEANPDEFMTPATVEARHILIKVDEGADETAVEAARLRAVEIEQKAKAGDDFADLAKTYSEGPSKDQGGFLGAFQREQMVKPFADKAFAMAPDEISEPVRTQFGWHVIKVEKHNPEVRQTLEEVRDRVRTQLQSDRAKTLAYDLAEEIYEEAFEDDNLTAIAEARELSLNTADDFSRQGPVEGVADGSRFAAAAFDLPLNVISEVQEFSDGYYLLQVEEEKPASDQSLAVVRDQVLADLTTERQQAQASEDAAKLLAAVKGGADLVSAGQEFGLQPKTSEDFKRRGSIADLGFEPEINAAAFKLTSEKPLADAVIQGKGGAFVIRLKDRKKPAAEDFE
ncbi:MAG: SurA N-terminal domain-containing protein, partial [Desulfobacterales bacterium]